MLKKIRILCITILLCFTTLQGCTSSLRVAEASRVERLEFELYSITSRLERLESKLDLMSWSTSQPLASGRTKLQTEAEEQLQKLVVELKTQVSRLNEQLVPHN